MLSRTADHVYWLGRYAERAENFARTLDVQYRLSLLPQEAQSDGVGWQRMLTTLGFSDEYAGRHDTLEPHHVIDFLAFDRGNPSSILNCLRMARENARAVRGTISSEMWETFNSTWLEARTNAPVALQREQRRRVRRLGEVSRTPGPRRGARLDAEGRGLPLHADRDVPRARRRSRAPAADAARVRAVRPRRQAGRARLLRVERAAAGTFGLRDLPPRVPRQRDADERACIHDLPAGRAPLRVSIDLAGVRKPAGREELPFGGNRAAGRPAARVAQVRHARFGTARRRRAASSTASSRRPRT